MIEFKYKVIDEKFGANYNNEDAVHRRVDFFCRE